MDKNTRVFMWYKVKELSGKGFNKSQISRKLCIDRGTVRKYLGMSEAKFSTWINKNRLSTQKLASYRSYVKLLLEDASYLSAAQVEDRLKEKYGDFPTVHSKTVYNFVQTVRSRYDLPKTIEKSPRQYQKLPDPEYGEEAQVDFGEYNMLTEGSNRVKVYFLAMVLCRSRYKYVYCQCQPFTTATAVYAHELAFSYFKGIPRKIIYDQDRVFIREENLGDVVLTDGFRGFCNQQPFEVVFCRKSDPESKGKVENVVKYVKHNYLKGRVYKNPTLLQQECLSWLERTGNEKIHGTTQKIPREEWEKEQGYLLQYNQEPQLPIEDIPTYKVRKDNIIVYKSNFYSLPMGTYQGVDTEVKVSIEGITINISSIDNELIASHTISLGKGCDVRNGDHSREKSSSLLQTHSLVLEMLGGSPIAQSYLKLLEKDKPRYYRDNLIAISKGIANKSDGVISKALALCLDSNTFNGNQFSESLNYFQREEEFVANYSNVQIPTTEKSHIEAELIPSNSNIGTYQSLLQSL